MKYKLKLSLEMAGRCSLYFELIVGPRLTGGPQSENLWAVAKGARARAASQANRVALVIGLQIRCFTVFLLVVSGNCANAATLARMGVGINGLPMVYVLLPSDCVSW